jgi:ribosomal protein S18 acetylase RimI-like enzyme
MVVRIRRALFQDAPGIARVHVDTWRGTYRGIVPDSYLDSLDYGRSQKNWEDGITDPSHRTALFVAEDDKNGIVGFAACGKVRDNKWGYSGELYAIYLNQRIQRMGSGKRLVLSVARDLEARGLESMLVWVLAENPYKRFYESIGGTYVGTSEIGLGGMKLKELGYGWRDLDSLISRLATD